MYMLKVLNDGNEWETVPCLFPTEQDALDYVGCFFNTEMDGLEPWIDYEIEKLDHMRPIE